MRYDDHDAFVVAQDLNGAGQGIFSVGIQIGIGFIEHDEKRIAEDRPRQPNSLPLPRGQRHAALADSRRVALRQTQNDVMHAGDLRRLQDGVGGCLLIEAANVFGNGAVEQGHILRQIADIPAEIFVSPLIERGPVEPHDALLGRPDSDQRL